MVCRHQRVRRMVEQHADRGFGEDERLIAEDEGGHFAQKPFEVGARVAAFAQTAERAILQVALILIDQDLTEIDLAGEVAVERPFADARRFSDLGHGDGIDAVFGEKTLSGLRGAVHDS